MYILYVDESGSVGDAREHFVLGAFAVHESDVQRLRAAVEEVSARHLDAHLSKRELHAQNIRSGSGFWRGIPKDVRYRLLEDLANLLGTFRSSRARFALFGVAKHPQGVPGADPLERPYEELFLRFTQMLVRLRVPDVGIAVADESRHESTLQPIVRNWQETGTRFAKLTKLVEVPLFVDSAATRLIQLADLVAHSIFRAYDREDDSLLRRILPAFDEDGGRRHGLVHLTPQHRTCACSACASRQAARPLNILSFE
ncbi:MAG TPA: DUF3800 domain-containing protein [Myxococcales bacterium]|nr:DUF3800 domain-containing protein [Myxococcales bacterium]